MEPAFDRLSLRSQLKTTPSDDELLNLATSVANNFHSDVSIAVQLSEWLASSGVNIMLENAIVADVASTGGPTSLSTLITPLYLRAGNAIVPKLGVSGRPAGGIDSLAQLPSYRTQFEQSQLEQALNCGGYVHFLSKGMMTPLDGRLFAIRQKAGLQAIPTLVASSLLAKKLAVGVRYVGLDLRVAPFGNFGKNFEEAKRNAHLFITVASKLGIKASVFLTNACYPYQPFIGRKESLVALDHIFNGTESSWLNEHHETCRLLALATLPQHSQRTAAHASRNELKKHFEQNIVIQGSNIEEFDSLVSCTKAAHKYQLCAKSDGFCNFDIEKLRDYIVGWQKKLSTTENDHADPIGLILLTQPGQWVEKGQPIASVRVDNTIKEDVILQISEMIANPLKNPIGKNLETIYG